MIICKLQKKLFMPSCFQSLKMLMQQSNCCEKLSVMMFGVKLVILLLSGQNIYMQYWTDGLDFEVTVKHIKFRTSYLKVGFYITINITRKGEWEPEVIRATKKVQ